MCKKIDSVKYEHMIGMVAEAVSLSLAVYTITSSLTYLVYPIEKMQNKRILTWEAYGEY